MRAVVRDSHASNYPFSKNFKNSFKAEYSHSLSIKINSKKIYVLKLCISWKTSGIIVIALRDLVTFTQFKKREKHPWWSITFRY